MPFRKEGKAQVRPAGQAGYPTRLHSFVRHGLQSGAVSPCFEKGQKFTLAREFTLLSHPLSRVTEGNGTRHTCVSVPFLLFLLS